MQKMLFVLLALALIISAYFMGKSHGEMDVILKQRIWQEDGYFYAEYEDNFYEYD